MPTMPTTPTTIGHARVDRTLLELQRRRGWAIDPLPLELFCHRCPASLICASQNPDRSLYARFCCGCGRSFLVFQAGTAINEGADRDAYAYYEISACPLFVNETELSRQPERTSRILRVSSAWDIDDEEFERSHACKGTLVRSLDLSSIVGCPEGDEQ